MRRALLILLVLLVTPATAGAATVRGTDPPPPNPLEPGGGSSGVVTVSFTAAPGESNDLTVTDVGPLTRFRDIVALTAEGLCRQVDTTTADCPSASTSVSLGDEADEFAPDPGFAGDVSVDGGPGIDRLVAGTAPLRLAGGDDDDTVIGGDGADVLAGGPGSDRIEGGGGDDTLVGGPVADPGQDGYDGGPGFDTLDFLLAQGPVTIALEDGVTRSGGRDAVTAVEGAQAGISDDTLIGTAGPNRLIGNSGADEIEGLDGADEIDGGFGADRLFGDGGDDRIADGIGPDSVDAGAGNDLLTVDDDFYGNGADAFTCGAGVDTLTALGRRDSAAGCERQRLEYAGTVVDVVRKVRRTGPRRFTAKLLCVRTPVTRTCEPRTRPLLRLDRRGRPGRVLTRATRSLNRFRTTARVTFVLSRPAAKRLRKAGRRVHLALSDFGNQDTVPLRLPG